MAYEGWSITWDRERATRFGEERWWIDRGPARRQGLTKDQWLDKWATSQKALSKWSGLRCW